MKTQKFPFYLSVILGGPIYWVLEQQLERFEHRPREYVDVIKKNLSSVRIRPPPL